MAGLLQEGVAVRVCRGESRLDGEYSAVGQPGQVLMSTGRLFPPLHPRPGKSARSAISGDENE